MEHFSIAHRVLFVHNNPSRFVKIDKAILDNYYKVTEWYEPRWSTISLKKLIEAVKQHDFVFCWFASWHSFLPVLLARRLGKPAIVVVGGYDTANVPAASYGSQRGGLRRAIARVVIRGATHLIANSQAAKREAVYNAGADPDKITVIYHGIEPLFQGDFNNKEPLVLTVGKVWRENLLRKGLLPFVQAAAYLPDLKFVLAGHWYDDSIEILRQAAAPNVEFPGFVPDKELGALYARASIYVQASLHEGFGLSVAEAMLGGCIPMVTKVGSLPEVVGHTGFFLENNNPHEIAETIRVVERKLDLECNGEGNSSLRENARSRIINHFPLHRRSEALVKIVETALQKQPSQARYFSNQDTEYPPVSLES